MSLNEGSVSIAHVFDELKFETYSLERVPPSFCH